MVNYYAELGLDPGATQEQLEASLKSLRRTWTSRASTAADPDKRQQAEKKVVLIREATETLLNKEKRAKYDKKLDKDGAESASSRTEYAAPSAASTSFMDNAALMDMLERAYDNSQYNQAIAAANKLLENGVTEVEVYIEKKRSYLVYSEREHWLDHISYFTWVYSDGKKSFEEIFEILMKLGISIPAGEEKSVIRKLLEETVIFLTSEE